MIVARYMVPIQITYSLAQILTLIAEFGTDAPNQSTDPNHDKPEPNEPHRSTRGKKRQQPQAGDQRHATGADCLHEPFHTGPVADVGKSLTEAKRSHSPAHPRFDFR